METKEISSVVLKDFFNLMIGKHLGTGIARDVYECTIDKSIVIKVEQNARSFQNIREWENWHIWGYSGAAKNWLAPCVNISPCGTILLQKRTTPIITPPEYLPAFLTDRKLENFGIYEDRIVCHDYASIISSITNKKNKANWI